MSRRTGHRTRASLGWRGDRWQPTVARAIERRLEARRDRLAELLDISLSEREWQCEPGDRTRGKFVFRIDLVIDELTRELRTCWSLLRDVNRAASTAQVYRTLKAIEAKPEKFASCLLAIDPETRGWIEDHYPGGWMAVDAGPVDPALLGQTATRILAQFPVPLPGRPAGTTDVAGQTLAKALAAIYAGHSPDLPKRSRQWEQGGIEYGRYKEFVEEVLSVVPRRLRTTSKGGLKSVDHLVRIGVEHISPPSRRTES